MHSAIERAFDFVDGLAERADHLLNRAHRSENAIDAMRTRRDPDDARAEVARAEVSAPSTAIARRRYKIDEVTDAETGVVSWIVRDVTTGAKAECSTRALAEKVLRELETSS